MASTHTLTGNVYDLTGATLGATGVRVTVVTNLPAKSALIDKTTNSIHLGGKHADLDPSTGLFTIELIDTSATDLNVAANTLEYEVRAEYVNPATRVRSTWTSGWFPFTADANLADITTDVEPLAVESASGYALEAKGYRDEAEAISGLTGEDAAVAFLVEDSGSATAGALSATIATRVSSASNMLYIDSWTDFFSGGGFVTGQRTTTTTTTAAVSAGASVIPFASVTGVAAGFQFVTNEATPQQEIHTVASVAGSDVTIVGTATYAIASGATIRHLWVNDTHLSSYVPFAYHIANAQRPNGDYLIEGDAPKVTFLGNSWIAHGGAEYGNQIQARIPGATAVNAGVSGNGSTALLARFDTDVPADSDYVVFNEPGVNDDNGHTSQATQLANLAELVRKIRAIGATPIYTGHVPLVNQLTYSTAMQSVTDAAIGDGKTFPGVNATAFATRAAYVPNSTSIGLGTDSLNAVTSAVDSTAFGTGALDAITTGSGNTAVGARALTTATTATFNTAVGRDAMTGLSTGSNNTAVGYNAMRVASGGTANTAVGEGAGYSVSGSNNVLFGQRTGQNLTTGSSHTMIGQFAGYSPNGVVANATTTATGQTLLGAQTGLASTTQHSYITCLGYKATADGAGGFAIGTDSSGAGATSTAANEGVLGTANHTVSVPGKLKAAQRTIASATATGSAGEVCWDADYIYVCTATNTWKRTAISTW